MKNLKNIIASIILVVISFVSYTQTGTLKYEFYLTDSTDIENVTVDTFKVSNTFSNIYDFYLSEKTWDLGELNSNMNFSMDSTVYRTLDGVTDTINSAYVTEIYLVKDGIDITKVSGDFGYIETHNPPTIGSIDSLIHALIDSLENGVKYENLIFEIKGSKTNNYGPYTDKVYTGFAINYTVAEETVNDYTVAEEETAFDYTVAVELIEPIEPTDSTDSTASIDTEVLEVTNTRVYPNPVISSLNIEFETINTDTEVEIYSTNGQLMYKDVEYRNFGVNKVSVDVSNYPTGMYIVRLGNEVKKVIKQ